MLCPCVSMGWSHIDILQSYLSNKQLNKMGGVGTLLAVQLFLFGWVESKRWVDFFKPKSQAEPGSFLGFEPYLGGTGQNGYPGGPIFDPLGFSK